MTRPVRGNRAAAASSSSADKRKSGAAAKASPSSRGAGKAKAVMSKAVSKRGKKGDKRKVESAEDEDDDGDMIGDDDDYSGDGTNGVPDSSDDSEYQAEEDESSEEEEESPSEEDDDSDFEKPTKNKSAVPKRSRANGHKTPAASCSNSKPDSAAKSKAGNGKLNGAATQTDAKSAALAKEAAAAAGASSRGRHNAADVRSSALGDTEGGKMEAKPGNKDSKKDALRYVCEIAKTGRAMCRRCDEKITKEALKVGVVSEGTWGPSTQWHHLQCTIFQIDRAEDVMGFNDLEDALQPLVEQQILKSQGEVDDLYEPISPDDLVRKEWTEKAACPDEVMAALLPYQAEGLAWMLNQESLPYKGGVLADEMGMGKTLQAICTIVANRPDKKNKVMQRRWKESEEESDGPPVGPRGGTLVVCPTIAIKQWQSELARFVKPGTLKVVIHHGAKRTTSAQELIEADVVLTTYAIIENEHRKAYAGNKVACPDCGRTLYPDKMFVHRKYFCGENAKRTEAQAKTQRKRGAQGKLKGKTLDSDDDGEDNGTTKINVRVKKGNNNGKSNTTKGKKGGKAAAALDSDGDEADGGTTKIPTKKRRLSGGRGKAAAGTGTSKGKGKSAAAADEDDDEDDDSDPGTATLPSKKGGGKGKPSKVKAAAKGKAKSKGKGRSKGDDLDKDSDYHEGTTDISGKTGRGKGTKKGEKRKRAAADSDSDDDSDVSRGRRRTVPKRELARKEAAFKQLLKDMMDKREQAEPGVLQEISWQRIMLDEAHYIKDRSTSTAKAIFALTSLYKWCLTGTPLQNRVGELYSLVRFLRLDPYAYYQCRSKGCDCKSLSYRFGPEWRACVECGHTPIMHYANFNRHILNPISRNGYVGEGKKAFLKLKNEVLDQILLRRTKSNRSNDICLPPRIVRVRQHRLDEREEDFYQALYTQSQAQFDTYVAGGTILNNYAHIFDILIRLRQAVDHPYLVIYSATKREGMTPAMAPQTLHPIAAPEIPPTDPSTITSSSSSAPASARSATSSGLAASVAVSRRLLGGRGPSGGVHVPGDTSSDSDSAEIPKHQSGLQANGMAGQDVFSGVGVEDEPDCDDADVCGICTEPAERPVSSECGHSFCRTCVQELIDTAVCDVECPTCSQPLTVDLSGGSPGGDDNDEDFANGDDDETDGRRRGSRGGRGRRGVGGRGRGRGRGRSGGATAKGRMAGMVAALEASVHRKGAGNVKEKNHGMARSVTTHSVINRIDLSKFQSSTKMEALMEEVHLMQERDPAAKAIVFSQFVNMLDLIEYRMQKGGVGCRKLSGHLSIDKRETVLQAFQNDPDVHVLLISLKAGGVALNLTVANHIFLMDPWWNPAAEMQAIDRTHRLGQFKPIYATRFIIENTVEERIIKLQEKKQLVFDSTVGADVASTGKLTVDDLRFLFAH